MAAAGVRIAVLVSGSGTNLQALLDAERCSQARSASPIPEGSVRTALGGRIVLVAADRDDAFGLVRARKAGVDAVTVRFDDYPVRDDWDAALFATVGKHAPDLVVLAGFMRVLAPRWMARWPLLNTHPSLLPAFPGAHAVRDALAYGVKVTGATVHFVIEEVDAGPIVAQEPVPVEPDDDEARLHQRIKAVEHRLLREAVALYCHGRLAVEGRKVRVHAC